MDDARFGSARELLDELSKADRALERALAVDRIMELLEKFEELGDVSARLRELNQILPLFRNLRAERPEPTMRMLRATRSELRQLRDLLARLGNLERFGNQIRLLGDLREAMTDRGELGEIYRKLDGDLEEKLDILKKLLPCIAAMARPMAQA